MIRMLDTVAGEVQNDRVNNRAGWTRRGMIQRHELVSNTRRGGRASAERDKHENDLEDLHFAVARAARPCFYLRSQITGGPPVPQFTTRAAARNCYPSDSEPFFAGCKSRCFQRPAHAD